MTPELEQKINTWKKKSSDKKEHRSASIKPDRVRPNQDDILLKIEVRVVGIHQTEKVTVKRRMTTQGGGSEADLKTFDDQVAILEEDFRFRSGQAYNRIEQMGGDSFIERNPYS